jgi:NADH-quinone oxidoreductase subunit J
MPPILFWFLAALSTVAALGVVVQRNPVHCLLALVLTLISIAVLFIGQDAVVVGFLQVIVYAGAIMVLFLFVIWLLNLPVETGSTGRLAIKFLGAIGVAALLAELESFAMPARLQVQFSATHAAGYGSMEALAQALFAQYLIAFEVTSVLLLVAVVGAVGLARRSTAVEVQERAEQRARVEKAA